MIRPPPLQLKYDNRFPFPLKTPRPPRKSFFSQLYKANWKNPIIALAFLNVLRYAFATYNAFSDAIIDAEESGTNLLRVSIALSVMYFISCSVEIYGIVSVSTQRMGLVRIYMYLSFVGAIVVTCAGATKGISYFVFAEDIVLQCVSLARRGRIGEKSTFRSQIWPGPNALRRIGAHKHCVYSWVYQSWSEVASVFLFALIPAVISCILVYIYYGQTTNPKHHACLIRNRRRLTTGGSQRRPNPGQGGYNRVATRESQDGGPGMDNQSQDRMSNVRLQAAGQRSAKRRLQVSQRSQGANSTSMSVNNNVNRNTNMQSSGSTAGAAKKPPFVYKSLQRSNRPPPLVASPSPIGLGPPNYGPSKVYAAFAAPLATSDYDKFV